MLKIQRGKLWKPGLPDLLQESTNPYSSDAKELGGLVTLPGTVLCLICIFFVEASVQDDLLSSLSSKGDNLEL